MTRMLPLLLGVLLTAHASAQQTVTVVDSGFAVFTQDLTRGQVRGQAQDLLFRNAIIRATGVRIVTETFGSKEERDAQYQEMFREVNRSSSYGHVIDWHILSEGIVSQRFGTDLVEGYRIVAECEVAVDNEDPDPAFQLAMKLNKDIYYGNESVAGSDEVIITLESSADAWLTLFGVFGDSVTLLLPNRHEPGNLLRGGSAVEFPSVRMREDLGLRYRATIAPGESRSSEMVFAIATRDSIPFREGVIRGGGKLVPTYHAGLADLYRWLSQIKPRRRTEAHRIFEIRRAGQ